MAHRLPVRVWGKLGLTFRLVVISGVLFVLGGSVLLRTMVEQVVDNRRTTLSESLQSETQDVTQIIGEYAVIGDYASIQQVLSKRAKRTDILLVEWKDQAGKAILADSSVLRVQAPTWFIRWIDIPPFKATAAVRVGGNVYGSVLLELSHAPSINFLWQTFKQQALILGLSMAVFYTIMILYLWNALMPLQALVKGTIKFGEGDHSVRVQPAGAPEISASIAAFNRMADTIQNLLAFSLEKETHLHAVMNSIDDAIIIMDEWHVIESFNQATPRLFANSTDQLHGCHLMSLLEGSWEEKYHTPEDQFQGLETETYGRRGDGALFPINLKIKKLQSQGRFLFMANVRDITNHRKAEALRAQELERLEIYQATTEQELRLAHHVFQTITSENARKPAPIELWTQPMGLFNGDLLLYEYSPSGELRVILCDFMGHGLGAAIGAIPVADVFLGMSKKGYGISDIAAEINNKLKRILPTGHFCAACLISVNQDQQSMEIWNGGLPPILILGKDREIIRRVVSRKLPLGILATKEFDAHTEIISLQGVRSAFVYSDGLVEVHNAQNEMMGQAALEKMIEALPSTNSWLESVKSETIRFLGDCTLGDDLSLLHIRCDTPYASPVVAVDPHPETAMGSETVHGSWRIELQLSGDMIKNCTPIPLLMSWLIGLNFSELQRSHIYTILSELINNAVDHGLLRIDSMLKSKPNGFEDYYATRQKLLAELNHGILTVQLSQIQLDHNKKTIQISVKDTGKGFNFGQIFSRLDNNDKSFGRGIALVDSLSNKLHYSNGGNSVVVEYVE